MEIMRTANAGVLLKLDNASILLDGVCREVSPYPATPLWVKEALQKQLPDAVCFTHDHADHYDPDFAAFYRSATGRKIPGPSTVGHCQKLCIGDVTITAIPSRHIGKAGATTEHMSFVIEGSRCVWFMGDSAPTQWRGREDLNKPDVLMVPFAYAITPAAWELTKSLGAKQILLLHMPQRSNDPVGLWPAVEAVVGKIPNTQLMYIPVGCSICYEINC